MSFRRTVMDPLAASRRSLRARWVRHMLTRRDLDPAASVVICSEPRSGSTWLMELIGQLPGAVCNWEPFHPTRGVLPRERDMGWRPFVPAEEPDPLLEAWFDDLLRFRIGNSWTLSRVDRHAAASAEIGVHKFVRASLLLPWMVTHLPLERRPVFLVRHPFATISSQDTNFAGVRAMSTPSAGRRPTDEYSAIVAEQKVPELLLVARWCEINRTVLNQPLLDEKLIVVHYEHLVLEPERRWRVFWGNLLGRPASAPRARSTSAAPAVRTFSAASPLIRPPS